MSNPDILYLYIIVVIFSRIAGSNIKLLADKLILAERYTILIEIKLGR